MLVPVTMLAVFFSGMAIVQFASPDLPDNDGFYHIKFAYLMRTQGLKPEFTWLPLSILNRAEFSDHHFLFHVALIPFTFGDLRLGAKWAAVAFASLAFLAMWLLLQRQRVPLAWLWALGLLGVSEAFLYRMSITRAQSLSLALLALGMLWLIENKHWHLGALAFAYVWLYDAFPLLLALALLHALAVALLERRLEWRPLAFIAGGIALGLLINPYFPDNIIFAFRHMLPKFADATSVRVGNEWYPYDTAQLLGNSAGALIAFVSGVLALGLAARKMDVRTAFAFFTTLLFGLMLLEARRFVEYFPVFALIFAAFAWAPLLSMKVPLGTDPSAQRPLQALRPQLPAVLLAALVAFAAIRSIPAAGGRLDDSKPYELYAGASAWLEHNTPAGARVFQTDWDDFPRLFFYNTHNTYLAGLDPTYMQLYDAALYARWVDITQGRLQAPSHAIVADFEARYVHTDLNHKDFLRVAAQDIGLREVYRDDQAVLFEVIAP